MRNDRFFEKIAVAPTTVPGSSPLAPRLFGHFRQAGGEAHCRAMGICRIFYIMILCAGQLLPLSAASLSDFNVKAFGEKSKIEFSFERNAFVFTNGVVITYSNAVLTADWGVASPQTREAEVHGNVVLQRDAHTWKGESAKYNFNTGVFESGKFRTGSVPVFISGDSASSTRSNNTYVVERPRLTTDDVDEPGYTIRAKEFTFVPGEFVEAKGATLYLGNTPVMYFPLYHRSLKRHPNNVVLTPGFRSVYGPYLLTAYNWYWNDKLSGAVHLDYRQRRGFGVGPDVNYDLEKFGAGQFSFYYLRDEEPGLNPAQLPIPDERRRIEFYHQADLATNLTARIMVRDYSDAQIQRDFFESEHRRNPQPNSFLEINQAWSNFNLNVLAQPQINDFYETIERLPDLRFDAFRQQLGESPIYYESQSSIGYFQRKFSDDLIPDYGAMRADSYHQLVLPKNFFGWLNVAPRVGGRLTYYGETDGLGSTLDAESRWVFNTGVELSSKASRTWPGVRNKFWEMDGVRHIFEPTVNYAFVPSPNKLPPQLPQFDYELPTFRLLPLDYPDYNSIDSIDSQNVIRYGVRNKVQTKRDGQVVNFLNWAIYTDWRVHPRPDQSTFADIYSDLDWEPWSWLTLSSQTRYDIGEGRLKESDHWATLTPEDWWSWSVGHRYLKDDIFLGQGNNTLMSSLYLRFNENWGARMTHHFEARDGVMEEQYYTLYRDLRSWTVGLTLRLRDHRERPNDVTIGVTFSLKAFPRFKLGSDRDTPQKLLGG